jgi:hypothetical protein
VFLLLRYSPVSLISVLVPRDLCADTRKKQNRGSRTNARLPGEASARRAVVSQVAAARRRNSDVGRLRRPCPVADAAALEVRLRCIVHGRRRVV